MEKHWIFRFQIVPRQIRVSISSNPPTSVQAEVSPPARAKAQAEAQRAHKARHEGLPEDRSTTWTPSGRRWTTRSDQYQFHRKALNISETSNQILFQNFLLNRPKPACRKRTKSATGPPEEISTTWPPFCRHPSDGSRGS